MSDHNFNTPPEFLQIVRKLTLGGRIGLDPCSNEHSMVNALYSHDIESNGLIQPWREQGLVFVNPPHSMSPFNIEPWWEKAYQEFVVKGHDYAHSDSILLLTPAKTDTAWFQDHASKFAIHCFLRGRLRYWLNGEVTPGPGKFAQLVTYHGPCVGLFASLFSDMGWVV